MILGALYCNILLATVENVNISKYYCLYTLPTYLRPARVKIVRTHACTRIAYTKRRFIISTVLYYNHIFTIVISTRQYCKLP